MLERMPLVVSPRRAPCSQLVCVRRALDDAGDGHAKGSDGQRGAHLSDVSSRARANRREGDSEDTGRRLRYPES